MDGASFGTFWATVISVELMDIAFQLTPSSLPLRYQISMGAFNWRDARDINDEDHCRCF